MHLASVKTREKGLKNSLPELCILDIQLYVNFKEKVMSLKTKVTKSHRIILLSNFATLNITLLLALLE